MTKKKYDELLYFYKYLKKKTNDLDLESIKIFINFLIRKRLLCLPRTGCKTDVLFLYPHRTFFSRLRPLEDAVKKRGLNTCSIYVSHITQVLRLAFGPVDDDIPDELVIAASISKYLINKYMPKVICTLDDSSIIAPFLRRDVNTIGGKLVNLAHSVVAPSFRYSMCDFDYYFLFGPSSLINIKRNPVIYGTTSLVMTGPVVFPSVSRRPASSEAFGQVLFLLDYPDRHYRSAQLEIATVVLEWISKYRHRKLLLRRHPMGIDRKVELMFAGVGNACAVTNSLRLVDSLSKVDAVLSGFSNATLEAALLGVPTIPIGSQSDLDDYLNLGTFFPPLVRDADALEQSLQSMLRNYKASQSQCAKFCEFHLKNPISAIDYASSLLKDIAFGKPVHVDESLYGTIYC